MPSSLVSLFAGFVHSSFFLAFLKYIPLVRIVIRLRAVQERTIEYLQRKIQIAPR